MGWIALILVTAFLYGTILMVRPSKRQRRIARLRQEAASLGMEVRLTALMQLADALPRGDGVCLIWHRDKKHPGTSGVCTRAEGGQLRPSGIFLRCEAQLEDFYQGLPAGIEALVSSARYVAVCWDESGDSEALQRIRNQLPQLAEMTAN